MKLEFDLEGIDWDRLKSTGMRNLVADTVAETMTNWHRLVHRLRFIPGAQRAWNLARRTSRYLKRKRKEKGHTTDLVWSGATREMAASTRRVQKAARSGAVTVSFKRPKYAEFGVRRTWTKNGEVQSGGRRGPDIRKELKSLGQKDSVYIRENMPKFMAFLLKTDRRKYFTKRKKRVTA